MDYRTGMVLLRQAIARTRVSSLAHEQDTVTTSGLLHWPNRAK